MSTEHEMSRRGRVVGESYRDACERLAGQLRAAEIDLARAHAQREAVLAIHQNVRGQGYADDGYGHVPAACSECGTSDEYAVEWPCATVKALGGVS